MTQFLMRLWSEERGENLPEYALLLILVCLTAVSSVGSMAAKVNNIYSSASTRMTAAANPALTSGSISFAAESPADIVARTKGYKESTRNN